MTFTEAALEVLRSAGEPLHYKRITELAIEKNLLSHVGKTPEVTMSSRLAMMVKKDRGQAPIMKVKPGVFAIRESALEDFAAAAAAAAANEAEATIEEPGAVAAPKPEPVVAQLPGGDVFPEEEGDDDPILAGLEKEGSEEDKNGRRRRRRRRRGKGGDRPEGAPELPVRVEAPREPIRERPRDLPRDQGRDRMRDNGRDHGRDRDRDRDRGRVEETAQLDWNRQPADGDLLGKDLADAVWSVLSRGDHGPHTFVRVAELLVRRGRLSGNPAGLAPTIAASVRADISRAELTRTHSRFRVRGGRLSLTEWLLPRPLARVEQDLLAAAERYGVELRRTLIQKFGILPAAGFAELIATWLNAEGVTALRAVRRPGSSVSEFHFAGTLKRGSEETRLAIVVVRTAREIDRDTVVEVRGALHHYGQASSAWILSTGRMTSGARDEAAMAGAAPCALFDGMAIATAMERVGVAVRTQAIAHHELDLDLLEALGDNSEQRELREREQRERAPEPRRRDREAQGSTERSDDDRGRGGEERGEAARDAQGNEAGEQRQSEGSERVQSEPTTRAQPTDADWDEELDESQREAGEADDAVGEADERGEDEIDVPFEHDDMPDEIDEESSEDETEGSDEEPVEA
ncbi:MAG TPA: HTH domain-containing protein [Polyangiales bacterium]